MDRCALFVDAGYVLADGAMAVHAIRDRNSVSWDYAGVTRFLGDVARDRTGLPLLRCYWYDATVEGRRTHEHEMLADLPGVKLRLGGMRPGQREGVESEIRRDLATLARNNAISDAVVVSAGEDLVQVITEVQDLGIRVTLLNITIDGRPSASPLRQECDDILEIGGAHLHPYVTPAVGAEPAQVGQAYSNGHAPVGTLAPQQPQPVGAPAGSAGMYPVPAAAEYQLPAQPPQSPPTEVQLPPNGQVTVSAPGTGYPQRTGQPQTTGQPLPRVEPAMGEAGGQPGPKVRAPAGDQAGGAGRHHGAHHPGASFPAGPVPAHVSPLPGGTQAAGIPPAQHLGPVPAQQYPPQPYVPQQGLHGGPQQAAQPGPGEQVQAALGEGFAFGRAVARDAPALWLEAVLARRPRMPSDLEARLLQESALPIDSLLHDEVRHALRRGFWDALERSRHAQ